jgi:hypothetical protein
MNGPLPKNVNDFYNGFHASKAVCGQLLAISQTFRPDTAAGQRGRREKATVAVRSGRVAERCSAGKVLGP